MKHSLQLKLSQHLTLTPQLQQSIRLLQLSTLELNQEIERFLQENPLLERDDGAEDDGAAPPASGPLTPEYTSSDHHHLDHHREGGRAAIAPTCPSPRRNGARTAAAATAATTTAKTANYPQLAADSPSLREHLLWQVNLLQCPDRDKRIVALLVDTLDDDGYLTQDLEELAALLPAELELEPSELRDRAQAPAEPGAARHRRAQPGRMPGAAARGAAGRHAVPRRRARPRCATIWTCSPRATSPS